MPGRSRLLQLTGVPLAAFIVARAVVFLASARAGLGYPGAGDLTRRDAVLYLSIARHGYTLYPCDRVGGWCGNSGWLPLYSVLIAPSTHVGLSARTAGALLAGVCQLGTLILLWHLASERRTTRNVLMLLAAAVFPGAVYYAAVFPLSLLTLLTLACFALLSSGRRGWAAVAAGLAAATYPLGIAVAIGAAVYEVVRHRRGDRYQRIALPLAGGGAGLFAVAVWQRLAVGHWDAYLLVQRHYQHNGASPWTTLLYAKASALSFMRHPHRLDLVPQLQLLLVVALVLLVLVVCVLSRQLPDVALVTFVGVAWAMPLVLGGVSLYRSDAALVPGLLVVRRLPVPLLAILVVLAALIGYEIDRQFFDQQLA